MLLQPTDVEAAFILEPSRHPDERGHFINVWSRSLFASAGCDLSFDYGCISYNHRRGTLRGLHFQDGRAAETKLVQCLRGSFFDVAVDLRPFSPSYLKIAYTNLSAGDGRAFLIPSGCAHGYQTLEDETEVGYLISGAYTPSAARTIAWNDPTLSIPWPPCEDRIISEKDMNAKQFET
uniref:dTDP-4-deoxyrhamnose-3,5-epimerase n=1 Tax=mine drainage metagenome TaxID=410659 RepID=E6Q720_9ZZZZ